MKKQIVKSYDLDDITILEKYKILWVNYVKEKAEPLRKKYPKLKMEDIPDERLRIYSDGSAEIYVKVKDTVLTMEVKEGDYSIK